MLWIVLLKLMKPLCYLKIKHEQKFIVDCYIPIFFAISAMLAIYAVPLPIAFLGKSGLISLINGLFQMLIGFFVASLAAVATFQRVGMDELMQGNCTTLNGRLITRREFLCYMFGYLAFMSIVVYFGGGVVDITAPLLRNMLDSYHIYSYIAKFIYLFVVSNILFTTFLSLHFLTDRMVRRELARPKVEKQP